MGGAPPHVSRLQGTPRSGLVYRNLLGGGDEPWCLSRADCGLLAVAGVLLPCVGLAAGAAESLGWGAAALVLGHMFSGLCVAVISARWLGRRTGTLAGLLYLSSLYVLLPGRHSTMLSVFSLTVVAAMGAFAGAEVPGRRPPAERGPAFCVFCVALAAAGVLGGLAGSGCLLGVCFVYLLLFQDVRGLGFFAGWPKVALAAVCAGGPCLAIHLLASPDPWHGLPPGAAPDWRGMWSSGPEGGFAGVGPGMLPWAPLALVAIVAGLRQGHYATPFARLLLAWLAVPAALGLLGILPAGLAWASFAPWVAIVSGAGLVECVAWRRRRRTRAAAA